MSRRPELLTLNEVTTGSVRRRSATPLSAQLQTKNRRDVRRGRVHEIKISVLIDALSSSILARYRLSPVSLRSFLASLVRRTDERVSFIPTTIETSIKVVTLAERQINISISLHDGGHSHDVEPLNPSPFKS